MDGRQRFGIDAPIVVRTLTGVGGALTALAAAVRLTPALAMLRPLAPTIAATAVITSAMSLWMLISSLWLKRLVRDAMLRERRWRGDERVLDIGCGRGLFAVGAAGCVPLGTVVGLDRWQAADLSGNSADAIRLNAAAAGVADRLVVETGDARALPFADASFDVVGSMTVIHNIPDAAGRAAAVTELWRVTKPGGQVLLYDIRHGRRYARQLKTLGALDLRMSWPILLWGVLGWRFSAIKPNAHG